MKDEDFLIARLNELYNRREYGDGIAFSDFFSYSELVRINLLLPRFVRENAVLFGGYEEAERNCFFFFGDKIDEEERLTLMEEKIHCYLIEHASPKYASDLTHSSILGKLMSLGIKREMLGDIIASPHQAVVFALSKIESEMLGVEDVGKDGVSVRRIDYVDSPLQAQFETIRITYESNRLDAIISDVFHLSREEAKEAIERGLVYITSTLSPKPSSRVQEGDHLSMKGKGKVTFLGEVGLTKKGKTIAEIKVPK